MQLLQGQSHRSNLRLMEMVNGEVTNICQANSPTNFGQNQSVLEFVLVVYFQKNFALTAFELSLVHDNYQIKSNHFYCHITKARVPWWVKFLRACSRQCRNNLHIDSTNLQTYTEDNVQNAHTYSQYTQCTIRHTCSYQYTLYTKCTHFTLCTPIYTMVCKKN